MRNPSLVRFAAITLAAAASGCAVAPYVTPKPDPVIQDAVPLRLARAFSFDEMRSLGWYDACGLQAFFDRSPTSLSVVTTRVTHRPKEAGVTDIGQITVRIARASEREMFRRLLSSFYVATPVDGGPQPIEVTLDYYRYCGKPRMLLNSRVQVRQGPRHFRLAFHPCIGELLLNGDIYAQRRELIAPPRITLAQALQGKL